MLATLVGLDAIEAMVSQARLSMEQLPQVEIRRGDAMSLDLPDCSFDAVYSERVFMHLDRPTAAANEVVRVTKPGGRVMIVDPDHSMTRVDVVDIETGALLFWTLATTKMKNPRSGTLLLAQLRETGLEDVGISGT
jgi:ubiquinone/menaquinone biosynthesis C-methylase UbiE